MFCEGEACAECTRRCVLIHGKKDHQPDTSITSFFKVMIGDEFSTVLFLPPKFARTVSALLDQKIDLEDVVGQRWRVTLSNLKGSLALQEGWPSFSLDHGLTVGDFLVFHYIEESHFVVQIYKRTGCENLDFPWEKGNCKKRKRTCRDFVTKNGSCHTVEKGIIDKQSSSSSVVFRSNIEINQSHCNVNDVEAVPTSKRNTSNCENSNLRPQPMANTGCIEELFCMADRDIGYKGEDCNTLFDLSNFEMFKTIAGAGEDEKVPVEDGRVHHVDVSLKSQTEADLAGSGSVAEELVGRVVPSEASNVEMLEKNNEYEVADNMVSSNKDICNGTTSGNFLNASVAKARNDGNTNQDVLNQKFRTAEILCDRHAGKDQLLISQKELALTISCQSIQRKSGKIPAIRDFPVAFEMQKFQSGQKKVVVKKEPVEMVRRCEDVTEELQGERMKVVKKEHVEVVWGCEDVTQESQGKGPNLSVGVCEEIVNLPVKNSNDELLKIVKTEPVESISVPTSSAASISCLVPTDDQSFLELPALLPPPLKGRIKMSRRVVLLKDPVMRLWPVLYHETFAFKVLANGWEAFYKANNIRRGDECIFCIETEPKGTAEGIYRVQVIRREDRPG